MSNQPNLEKAVIDIASYVATAKMQKVADKAIRQRFRRRWFARRLKKHCKANLEKD